MPHEGRGNGAPLPAEPNKRWWKVIAPKGKTALKATILDDDWIAFWTHWVHNELNPKGRVVLCDGEQNCRLCKDGFGLRWTAYAAAKTWYPDALHVLAITEAAARTLRLERDKRGTLRGLVVILQRMLPHNNAPVHVSVCGMDAPENVPPSFDVMPSLLRMWGLSPRFKPRAWGVESAADRLAIDPNSPEALIRRQQGQRGGDVA